ncbi:histidinol-phosphate transaminase [Lottiidibacillus patelloidae]|nr:histidinol-phosphate transaminase [Lottiidibacillus patelloidae]
MMKTFVRETILNLKGYETKNTPYVYKLDANEGKTLFFSDQATSEREDFNRYPDNEATVLCEVMGKFLGVPTENIVAGNGSSEMIELIMKTFIDTGDGVLSFTPSFSMYEVFTNIYSGRFFSVPSRRDFSLDVDALIAKANEIKPKVILLCNPNNPTGAFLTEAEIKKVIEETNAIIVVDEAYIEFSDGSFVNQVNQYENVIVLRTVSKAFGLASIRLGFMVANKEVINIIKKVKPPYNLNSLSQKYGIEALQKTEKMSRYVLEIKQEREKLYQEMKKLNIEVYPSQANFLFFKSTLVDLAERLQEKGILIRQFSGDLAWYYRVTIGEKEENSAFLNGVKEMVSHASS